MNVKKLWPSVMTLVLACWALTLAGCMAQQADVVKMKQSLDSRIARLDQSRAELRTAVAEANQALKEANAIIAQQRSEIQDLLRARADLFDQMTTLREGDLSQVRGDLETNAHGLEKVSEDIEDIRQLITVAQEESRSRITRNTAAIENLTRQVEQQVESLAVHHRQDEGFRDSLLEFQQVLTTLRQNLERQQAGREALVTQVEEMATEKAKESSQVTGYLTEVKQSVGSVVKALEESNARLTQRLGEQEQRLTQLQTELQRSEHVSREIGAQAKYVEELRQSQSRLQHALDVVVNTLGARVDSHESQLAQLLNRSQGATRQSSSYPTSVTASVSSKPSSRPDSERNVSVPDSLRSSSDVQAYQYVQQKLHEKNYQEALKGFSDFLKDYPSSPLAGNAQYWMGECYYAMRKFSQAIQEFERVVYHYPSSKKVPAALLKIGYAYLELRDRQLAKATFQQLVRSYTGSPEAVKANARLLVLQ